MIKLITFDLDNTLWDANPVLVKAEQALYAWLQDNCPELASRYSIDTMRDHKTAVANENPELIHRVSALRLEALKRALYEVGYGGKEAEALAGQAFSVFHKARQRVTLFEHAQHVLESLSQRYKLAALTNGNADVAIIGLDHYFDFALSADDIGRQKPDPTMFLLALEKAKVDASQVVHIGDHPEHDIKGAQDVGLHTIWVDFDASGWQGEAEPTEVANCLSEIPKLISQIENSQFK
ncbi:HAD family hydrolase [Alkalimarinus coralli]|uniref:HAD family hydrolase n=1 Tax=Alkalimarinus coralli TaxID=2935863 RepID=UPI00202AD9A2|nr:HAD-IA family hydrolase [Alkalimarinus coralli]